MYIGTFGFVLLLKLYDEWTRFVNGQTTSYFKLFLFFHQFSLPV